MSEPYYSEKHLANSSNDGQCRLCEEPEERRAPLMIGGLILLECLAILGLLIWFMNPSENPGKQQRASHVGQRFVMNAEER